MKAISLFAGAGGLDLGFVKAGFEIEWSNDIDKDACRTYKANLGDHIRCGSIDFFLPSLDRFKDQLDLIIGGPPCQGFSVAGKMDPNDPRSKHVWTFANLVDKLQPRGFVMENVKALGQLERWKPLREELLRFFRKAGYAANFVVVNATDFDVPQSRERVLFIGFKANPVFVPDLATMLSPYKAKALPIRNTLLRLDKAGTGNNQSICKAKITLTNNPVMRKSPYAGMLFNGLGRPINLDGYCATLPASMGGNKTPIVDEQELYQGANGWVANYHSKLTKNLIIPEQAIVPSFLRRLTVEEASLIQTFPVDFNWHGSQSSKMKQIGNAVPCNLAHRIAMMMRDYLFEEEINKVLLDMEVNSLILR